MPSSLSAAFPRLAAVLGATALAAAITCGTAAAKPTGHTAAAQAGCPLGAVCIYPDDSQNGSPEAYFRYGAHDLQGKYGVHLVINNQTGGAGVQFCYGRNGQRCGPVNGPGTYHPNLTPINSIVLTK